MDTFPKFFKKAIKGNVGGLLLNKRGEVEEYLLKGDPTNPDADPDNMIVEIHNEDSEKFFIKSNKNALKNGYLVSINEYKITLDAVNAVTDGDLKDILKFPFAKMKKRVSEFTSPVPVQRLLEMAKDEDKSVKTINMIQTALENLDDTIEVPTSVVIGDVRVGGTRM